MHTRMLTIGLLTTVAAVLFMMPVVIADPDPEVIAAEYKAVFDNVIYTTRDGHELVRVPNGYQIPILRFWTDKTSGAVISQELILVDRTPAAGGGSGPWTCTGNACLANATCGNGDGDSFCSVSVQCPNGTISVNGDCMASSMSRRRCTTV